MRGAPRGLLLSLLATFALGARPALADSADAKRVVAPGLHRISGEVGTFILGKSSESPGAAFGLGYAYRALEGLEVGGGLRYFLVPGTASENPAVNDMALMAGSARVYLELDSADLVELGFAARLGLLALGKKGVCCGEVALAPDLRVWVDRTVALQLAPELALGTTGDRNGPPATDYVDVTFGQAVLWLAILHPL